MNAPPVMNTTRVVVLNASTREHVVGGTRIQRMHVGNLLTRITRDELEAATPAQEPAFCSVEVVDARHGLEQHVGKVSLASASCAARSRLLSSLGTRR